MSYHEAVEDKIPMEKHQGAWWYYPPCKICGTPVPSWNYVRKVQYTCPECKRYLVEAKLNGDSLDKKKIKLQEAVKRISRVADIRKYETAIRIVEGELNKRGWFQSTEEIMAAIELIQCGYKVHHQVKVYEYSVDFVIPELKVALEIDGRLFHGKDKREKEGLRDEVICSKLGEGWELIRIDTENINRNVTRLVPAIRAVKKSRKNKKSAV